MKMKKKLVQDPNGGFMAQRRQILNKNSDFLVQEAYKSLRTNIRFLLYGEHCKKIGITSAAAGEGKSITLLNLAISIAESGQKVLLIDADLRRPAQGRLLMEKVTPGLSNVLAGLATTEEAVRKEIYPNLDVLFSGDIPPNPSEILGSQAMEKLIATLEHKYDYILVDAPPVGVVSDACLVANLVDGVLLLVRQGRTKKDEVKRAVDSLNLTGARILGYVLNGVTVERGDSYGYYY